MMQIDVNLNVFKVYTVMMLVCRGPFALGKYRCILESGVKTSNPCYNEKFNN